MKKIITSLFVTATVALCGYRLSRGHNSAMVAPPATTTHPVTSALYRDGTYVGSMADAYYGWIQVKAIVQNGRLTDVQFLQYPNDRENSIQINTQAMPYLKQEAIQSQSAQVDVISGATDTSQAFVESLGAALAQAKA